MHVGLSCHPRERYDCKTIDPSHEKFNGKIFFMKEGRRCFGEYLHYLVSQSVTLFVQEPLTLDDSVCYVILQYFSMTFMIQTNTIEDTFFRRF